MALVPDHRIATLVAGALTLAAGAAIVAVAPKARLHRATGLFFGLRGGYLVLLSFERDLPDRLAVYLLIAIPFAAAWMALRLANDFGRRRPAAVSRWAAVVILAALAVCEAAYAADHGAVYGGWLSPFFVLQFVTYAAIALAIARELRRAAPGPSRRALFTFMLGFAGEPAYWSAFILAERPLGGVDPGLEYVGAAASIALLLAAAVALGGLRKGAREVVPTAALLGVAAATGLLSNLGAVTAAAPLGLLYFHNLNAAWTLWTVAATAYASLRYRLFGMDLRVKQFLRFGSTTFLLGAVFFVASETIEAAIGASTLWQSLAAAALVGLALAPLHKLTRRLAERWMPGVADTEEYRRRRREDIYLAAVERAGRDGFVDDGEREALRMLGRGLGLSGRDMARLETVRAEPVSAAS